MDQSDLTAAEALWVETMLSRLRDLRGFSLGIFGDFVVAVSLPGAVLSPGGTDRYDLTWQDIRVEVKTSRKGRWTVRPANGRDPQGVKVMQLWADVYVLALHEGADHRTGWSFYVLPRPSLNVDTPTTITRAQLDSSGLRRTDATGLPDAVLEASRAGPSAPGNGTNA